MHNDKGESKDKCNKEGRAKNARRRRDSRSRGLPRRSLTKRIYAETRNPPLASPSGKPQRVSITDSFGASPVSSALDHSARARPRQSDYNTNTQPKGLIINAPLSALQIYTSAR
jgi:hypothetical protein